MRRVVLGLVMAGVVAACSSTGSRLGSGLASPATDGLPQATETRRETAGATIAPTPSRSATPPTSHAPGCGPSVAPELPADFTPLEHQLSAPSVDDYPPIISTGRAVRDVGEAKDAFPPLIVPPARIGEADVQLILVESTVVGRRSGVRVYYASDPVGATEPLPLFVKRGGVLVGQRPTDGRDAERVKETLGERAAIIAIGPHQAALVHADPTEPSNSRAYHLYWSDGILDWTVIAGVEGPEGLIDFVRSMYC